MFASWARRPNPEDRIHRKQNDRIFQHTTEYIKNHKNKNDIKTEYEM